MIVKLQRPLAMPPNAVDDLLGEDLKGYFEALVGPDGRPVIGRRVKDQPW